MPRSLGRCQLSSRSWPRQPWPTPPTCKAKNISFCSWLSDLTYRVPWPSGTAHFLPCGCWQRETGQTLNSLEAGLPWPEAALTTTCPCFARSQPFSVPWELAPSPHLGESTPEWAGWWRNRESKFTLLQLGCTTHGGHVCTTNREQGKWWWGGNNFGSKRRVRVKTENSGMWNKVTESWIWVRQTDHAGISTAGPGNMQRNTC